MIKNNPSGAIIAAKNIVNAPDEADESGFLENALEGCNKAVVYLEQARDIYIKDIEGRAVCEDLIKRYILERRKIFNLYKAWQKFESYAKQRMITEQV